MYTKIELTSARSSMLMPPAAETTNCIWHVLIQLKSKLKPGTLKTFATHLYFSRHILSCKALMISCPVSQHWQDYLNKAERPSFIWRVRQGPVSRQEMAHQVCKIFNRAVSQWTPDQNHNQTSKKYIYFQIWKFVFIFYKMDSRKFKRQYYRGLGRRNQV